jgi:hypothetical protein
MYVCMYVCMYVYMYICIYVYMYMLYVEKYSFCSKLTDRTLLVIAAAPFSKHIFSLNLWGATSISDKGLQILCEYVSLYTHYICMRESVCV